MTDARFGPKEPFPRQERAEFSGTLIGGPGSHAGKVRNDLKFILSECEKNGTLNRLPDVAIYFTEGELRAIVAALELLP